MEFLTEKFVDFESLRLNDIDIQSLFNDQQWKNYFEMLNGFVYYDFVKNFWNKAAVFDEFCAEEEVRKMVAKDESLKGKSRVQLGLRPYKGKGIRSNLLGLNVLITQEHVAKVLGLDNKGEDVNLYKTKSKYTECIKKDLFPFGTQERDFGKAKCMKKEFHFSFKVFLASIITREGGKDTISLPHRHFIWFMQKRVNINLPGLIFDHLCSCISESHTKPKVTLHHTRLISKIIRQTQLVEIIRTKERLRVFNTAKFDATILVNMMLVKKEDIKKAEHPLKKIYEEYIWCDGFPTISEHDNEEVIKNFLEMVRRETGANVDRSMVVDVPDWDIFNGPKEITRSRKKPVVFEQAMIEEGSEGKNEDSGHDSLDEMIDTAAEEVSKAQEDRVVEVVPEADVEKERRSKKRNERPPATEDDQAVRAPKRTKIKAKRIPNKAAPKGNDSETNLNSKSVAQNLPTPSPTKDLSKPISMILPNQKHPTVLVSTSSSSSSSSESTLSDYSSDTVAEILRKSTRKLKSVK
ncbi:hypothetical protein QL285_008934 [Trifolium repens]|nr:hypothetical protein QL285_008934 [Trifolium repens]